MPIGRSQIRKQVEGKLRGARDEKKKKNVSSPNYIKSLRSSKFSQKVVQSRNCTTVKRI